jgi:hypothetical protein
MIYSSYYQNHEKISTNTVHSNRANFHVDVQPEYKVVLKTQYHCSLYLLTLMSFIFSGQYFSTATSNKETGLQLYL